MKEIYAIIELVEYGDYDNNNCESKIVKISFDKEEIEKENDLLNKNKNKIIENKWNEYHDTNEYGNYMEIYYYIQKLEIKM